MAYYYTPILTGAPARALTFNNPLQELDNAIYALARLPWISITDSPYNADRTGATDAAPAIQAAIDAACAVSYGAGTVTRGAVVFVPPGYYRCDTTLDLTNCQGVVLLGCNLRHGSSFWSISTLKFTSKTLYGIDVSNSSDVTIEKLSLVGSVGNIGQGGTLNNHAIYASNGTARLFKLNIHGWAGSAVRYDAGFFEMARIQATGCMYGYADGDVGGTPLSYDTGVVHCGGGEPILDLLNINGPFSKLSGNYTDGGGVVHTDGKYVAGHMAAVYCDAGPVRISRVVGAFAEVGFHFDGVGNSPSEIAECRSEFNQGHGWVLRASDCHFTACTAYDNGKSDNSTYSGFYSVYPGGTKYVLRNTFANCIVEGENNANTNRQMYGFTDNSFGAANIPIYQNRYDALCRIGVNMAPNARLFNFSTGGSNIIASVESHDWEQTLTGTGTLDFDGEGGNNWKAVLNANIATEITAHNLVPGQIYKLLIVQHSSGPPAITFNATMIPKTAGFVTPAVNKQVSGNFRATIIAGVVRLVQQGAWSGDM